MNVNPSLFLAAIAAPVPKIPATGPIEFRFRIDGNDIVVTMDPDKWDSICLGVEEIQGYALSQDGNETGGYLYYLSEMIFSLAQALFIGDTTSPGWTSWVKTLEFLLRALAVAVEQQFYPTRIT